MHFDNMNELQRRLHNAAIVAEADGDEWGHAGVMRDAISEIERLREALRKIANSDYRGNRSQESQIAYEALVPNV